MLDSLYPNVIPGPPRPSRILTPSGLQRQAGRERHVVPGGGALLLSIGQGDAIRIVNDEGAQPCELVAAHKDGRIDAGILNAKANATGEGLKSMLALGELAGAGLGRLRQGLARRQIDLSQGAAIRLFDLTTPAKAAESFTALADGHLVIAAPGPAMLPEAQNTTTPLTVHVTRANPGLRATFDLPDPLAVPLQDIRVASSTARAYHVKAGEYIQIIDVDGRQMTDFQCFSAAKIDAGLQRPLDVT
ncbi:MAG: DUF1989 domain-containing protein, partial [Pseudorhodobacter sp.]|nr:DUF1989 domain-containing protein [Pseudorhodobacter sp.]